MNKRVVITGIGIISPIGVGVSDFWKKCLDGTASVEKIPQHWDKYYSYSSTLWAPLPKVDYKSYRVSRVEQLQLDDSQLLSLGAAYLALQDASITYSIKDEKKNTYLLDGVSPSKGGVYIGTGIGGAKSLTSCTTNHVFTPTKALLTEDEYQEVNQHINIAPRYNPFIVTMTMPNACSARIGLKYSITGPNNTFCTACASGTVALGKAFNAVRSGTISYALAGGVEYLADNYGGIFRGFDVSGTLVKNCDDPATANRPFDKDRSGFLFAEGGGAVLVIEELSHALERGARIYSEITGFSETFDAHSIMGMTENGDEVKRMIHDALDQSELKPAEIDYVNTHGTGTMQNDVTESAVIADIFAGDVLVNATKSLTGHVIGASGAIEASVTALSLFNKTTHICKNLSDPISDLNFVTEVKDYPIRRAVTQSFAFGGHNAVLVLESY